MARGGRGRAPGAGGRLDAALEHARQAAEDRAAVRLPPAPARTPPPLPVSLLLPPPVAEALDATAAGEDVSLSRVVRECVAEALAALDAGAVVEADPAEVETPAATLAARGVVRRSVRLPATLMHRVRALAEQRGEHPGATARHLLAAGLELRCR